MSFVLAKCTNCGANLKVDNESDACICEFCHTPFVVEKAINNYNSYNNNVYNIQNANLNIENENLIEKKLENANIFLNKLNNKIKAREIYYYIIENYPGDYRGWLGLIELETDNYTKEFIDIPTEIQTYYNNVMAVSNDEVKIDINNKWRLYLKKCQDFKDRFNYEKILEKDLVKKHEKIKMLNTRKGYSIRIIVFSAIIFVLGLIFLSNTSNSDNESAIVALLLMPAIILLIIFISTLLITNNSLKKVRQNIKEIEDKLYSN